VATKATKKKSEFTRCPHCHLRYGSEQSLQNHVGEHRAKYVSEMFKPEHLAVLDPRAHHAELKAILKRGGHG
jgi:hypothetical protein